MIPLSVTPNLDLNPWVDLADAVIVNPDRTAMVERIGLLPNATGSGRACVELVLRLPDGRLVLAETTLRLFRTASAALLASPVAELDEP